MENENQISDATHCMNGQLYLIRKIEEGVKSGVFPSVDHLVGECAQPNSEITQTRTKALGFLLDDIKLMLPVAAHMVFLLRTDNSSHYSNSEEQEKDGEGHE